MCLYDIPLELALIFFFAAADNKAQLSFIESQLSASLEGQPQYLHLFARLMHSLVRVDPGERDPGEATRIVNQLEAWEPHK